MDKKKLLSLVKRIVKMRIGKKTTALVLMLALVVGFSFFQNAKAAALSTLSDTMSRLEASAESNHDIRFRTPSGMSSSTITINLETDADFSNTVSTVADYTDIDFQYGSSQAEVNGSCASNCTKASLLGTAGAGSWGAAFSGTNAANLTLTYPTSGGTAIAVNDYVRILIGTNAAEGGAGDATLENSDSTGTKTFTVNVAGTTDTGKIAVVIITDDQVILSTTIDPYISFTLTDNAVALVTAADGNPTYTATGYNKNDTNTLAVSTNGGSGYTLTYVGSTLTRSGGSETITAIGGTPAASATNTEQFGMNLKNNATPDVGAEPSGGTGAPAADYATADQYAFEAGTTPITLASAAGASATSTFTASYIANVTQTTESGAYNTTITYIATGNF